MKVRHLRRADFSRQPWKNGGGFTTELAIYRQAPPREEGDFVWRLSVAEVQTSGAFSDFSGYERTIMLLEGEGMELSFDARGPERIDTPHRPFVFDGGWKTSCRLLGGPVRDLNLMARKGRAIARIDVVTPPLQAATARWTLLFPLRGRARVGDHEAAPEELLVLEDAADAIEVIGTGTIARVRIDL